MDQLYLPCKPLDGDVEQVYRQWWYHEFDVTYTSPLSFAQQSVMLQKWAVSNIFIPFKEFSGASNC
jgi:hypothetical protein